MTLTGGQFYPHHRDVSGERQMSPGPSRSVCAVLAQHECKTQYGCKRAGRILIPCECNLVVCIGCCRQDTLAIWQAALDKSNPYQGLVEFHYHYNPISCVREYGVGSMLTFENINPRAHDDFALSDRKHCRLII